MSGGEVPYNLRPNKFVERQLFVELLGKICSREPSDEYVYISLGGPQLEDQRLVHRRLGIKNLISLESDPVVYKRQLFNLRPSYIQCWRANTSEFITNFDIFTEEYNDNKFVLWFDYASAQRYDQIVEYQTLLEKLQVSDILKITMNAAPFTLGNERDNESNVAVQKRRLKALRSQLEDFLPANSIHYSDMTTRKLPSILCNCIKKASLEATQNTNRQAVPLALFVYRDGAHQMLTITVRLVEKTHVNEFREDILKRGWEYLPKDWNDITRIKVPNLTAKERLYIEQLLFSKDHQDIHEELPFSFHSDQKQSLAVLEEYARHYKRYPSYFQVVL